MPVHVCSCIYDATSRRKLSKMTNILQFFNAIHWKSQTANLWTSQLVQWTAYWLVKTRTSQLGDFILFSVHCTMAFSDECTFTSMNLPSIFYTMLRFNGSLINTHDDNDDGQLVDATPNSKKNQEDTDTSATGQVVDKPTHRTLTHGLVSLWSG